MTNARHVKWWDTPARPPKLPPEIELDQLEGNPVGNQPLER